MFYKLQSYNFFCIYANKIAFGRFYWCRVYGVGCGEQARGLEDGALHLQFRGRPGAYWLEGF